MPVTTGTPSWLVVVTVRSTRSTPSSRADRRHLGRRRQRVAGPDLADEAHAVLGEHAVADVVGEHLGGGAHRQHAVGEHARVAGDLGREHLVGVQRVVVAGRPGVLDDLGAGAGCRRRPGWWCRRPSRCSCDRAMAAPQLSTTRSVRTPTPRAVMTSSPCWSRYSVMRLAEDELAGALALLLPCLAGLDRAGEHVAGADVAVVREVLLGVEPTAAAATATAVTRALLGCHARRLLAGPEPRLTDLRAQEVVGVELGARLGERRRRDHLLGRPSPTGRRPGSGRRRHGRTSGCGSPPRESGRWPWIPLRQVGRSVLAAGARPVRAERHQPCDAREATLPYSVASSRGSSWTSSMTT